MATYKQGVLGSFSGKVGTVVGSSWRGISYIRSLAQKVANPRTKGQLWARARLTAVTVALKQFATVIRAGFVGTGTTSPWSAAIKANTKALTDGDDPKVDMDKLVLSNGTAFFDVSATKSDSSVDFSWTIPTQTDEFYDGTLYAAAYNVGNAKGIYTPADLSVGKATFSFKSILDGTDTDDVHVYYFVAASKLSTATAHIGV